ncbi:PPOX class probable F420-dependent enzyme [Actinocorallia herbida]|uniref:PPOX class probable F420-dependent enzyme n=1 Tax=Actinocorallia herbida TaxID=58109 RepID=A0A3N1D945_9ACTN|nr:PPOX class F420-dependent oxidoreductase [Actinocorallia herbida]ROO89598.1 PPOX class probable F420-dependent enzyme [Actinocorallia herbida]
MSLPPLPAEAQDLLAKPLPCVIATVRSDGAPVTTPTWYLWENGRALLTMDADRVRLKHIRRDPHVSLTVIAEDWYSHVTLLGRVTELRDDVGLADADRISRHYTGREYPDRVRPRVTATITVDRWHGWGEFKDSDQASTEQSAI